MKSVFLALTILWVAVISPAHATVPDQYLDKEYEGCAGDGKDPQRNTYCGCIRNNMREWEMSEYDATLEAMAANMLGSGEPPQKMNDLQKECMDKALH